MSRNSEKKLIRSKLGGLPLLYSIVKKIGLKDIFQNYIPTHGNESIPVADTLILLIYNLVIGKSPLYKLEEWANDIDFHAVHLSNYSKDQFSDDRFGRALDKLYDADRSSMMTEIVVKVVNVFNINTDRIHNDSTSVKACGKIPGTTKSGLSLRHGHSKDHRPDLKQLLFTLSISADGAVPVHYKTYPGNRTDDTTHIESWKTLSKICGNVKFLYVADCKVCTDNQLEFITENGGRVITLIPKTWDETKEFKNTLRENPKDKIEILRRLKPGSSDKQEYFSCFAGDYKTEKRGYRIHWIFSSEKKKRDLYSREENLKKAEHALVELSTKINKRKLKERTDIESAVEGILKRRRVKSFLIANIAESTIMKKKQIGKGRPGRETKYKIVPTTIYSSHWSQDRKALEKETRVDGVFPLLSTDNAISPKDALIAYKYQPRIEKRFSQWKSLQNAGPLLFKSIERVEANMFAFFISQIVQALLEREIRQAMKEKNVVTLAIYPEGRESKSPTTNCIMDALEEVSRYHIVHDNEIQEEYSDKLNDTQRQILSLAGVSEREFWNI